MTGGQAQHVKSLCGGQLKQNMAPNIPQSPEYSTVSFGYERLTDWSLPVTSLTFYTGHIIDTLALKGFGAHSTRLVSSSKKPKS